MSNGIADRAYFTSQVRASSVWTMPPIDTRSARSKKRAHGGASSPSARSNSSSARANWRNACFSAPIFANAHASLACRIDTANVEPLACAMGRPRWNDANASSASS